MVLWWGKSDLTQFYNDAYISFLGAGKHPRWLGGSGRKCWSEIWHIIGPMLDSVFETGEGHLVGGFAAGFKPQCAASRGLFHVLLQSHLG
jgi:hypothetical protein